MYKDQILVGKPPGVLFSYGDLVTMADLFDSAKQMMEEDAGMLDSIKSLIREEVAGGSVSKLAVTLAGVVRSSADSTTSPSTAAGKATLPAPLLPGASCETTGPRLEPMSWPSTISPDEALIFGESFEGSGRGVEHGLVGGTLVRADEGSEHLRHGESEEEVRPGKLLLQVVGEPLRGFMLRALRAMTIATGMLHAVLASTAWALIEAVAVMAAAALLDGADDFAVRGGEVGIALQVCWRKGGEDLAQGGHGKSPCMRALMRA